MDAPGCPVDHHGFMPFDMKDPFPAYSELRRDEPVMFDERIGYFVVSRYDDVKATFNDWQSFSSENAQAPVRPMGSPAKKVMDDGGFTTYSGLSARVPPEHTRIRGVATKAFTPRRYKVLEPLIRQNVSQQIDAMLAKGKPGDILHDIAHDLPTITILTLLGVDTAMIPQVKEWSNSRAALTWGDLTDEEQVPHAHNLVAYWTFCQKLVSDSKANPGDDLVNDLVTLQASGEEISDHEVASFLYSLLFAGHETTTTLISNAIRVLLSHPDAYTSLVEDPTAIPAAIDEILRFSGSIVAWRRKATRDTEIAGVPIPEGAGVLLLMGSANRDDHVFPAPDTFDIGRDNARSHLSFGYGIHFCLGNLLAKLQAKVALEEITSRIPTLRMTSGADIDFGKNLSFRVPTSVPVEWSADLRRSRKTMSQYTFAFDSNETPEHDRLGGKCTSLAIMTAAGMPVPPGFAVTTAAFDAVMNQTTLRDHIVKRLENLDPHDVADVDSRAAHIRELILTQEVPADVRDATIAAFRELMDYCGNQNTPVAVRSSATAEDLPDASFAGQQDTYLWVVGEKDVLQRIRECWASLYTARAITYRMAHNISDEGLSMAVAIQKMVNARTSGVAMTIDPTNGDRSKVVVDSSWGLGEMVVSGEVTPDNFVIDKIMMHVVKRIISDKHEELVPSGHGTVIRKEVDDERRYSPSLSDTELITVARLAKAAEKHYGSVQDIEWAIDADLPPENNVLLLQSRPETVWSQKKQEVKVTSIGSGIEAITKSLMAQMGDRAKI